MVQTLRCLVLWVLIFGVAVVNAENKEIGELRRLAEQGDVEAQNRLGFIYKEGMGISESNDAAVRWFRKAAEQGHRYAQYSLGSMYAEGAGLPRDYVQAYALLNRVAVQRTDDYEQVDAFSDQLMVFLRGWMTSEQIAHAEELSKGDALLHDYGYGVPKNAAEAATWYHLAAEGYMKASFNEIDPDADAHYIEGLFSMGSMYDYGLWARENDVEAAEWYRLAAELGHAEAQYRLGHLYSSGPQDTPVDKEASEWVRRNIPDGVPFVYPVFVLSPDVVMTDMSEAEKWFRLAAEQGHARAQYELGSWYSILSASSMSTTQEADAAEAAKWFRKAAEQGLGWAQLNMGHRYADGDGVPQDYVQAFAWLRLTPTLTDWDGDEVGKSDELMAFLRDRMTPEQIAQAEALSTLLLKPIEAAR